MIHSVHGRMSLLFAGFLILVLLSVTASFFLIDAHHLDAEVINLAGRQRMLIQQMVSLALEYELGGDLEHLSALNETENTFEQSLAALESGGNIIETTGRIPQSRIAIRQLAIPATTDPQILLQLGIVKTKWVQFQASLDILSAADYSPSADASIKSNSELLMAETDELVRMYKTSSTAKVERLRLVQVLFLAGASLVLGLGAILIQVSILKPLSQLGIVAERIGEGDLTTSIQVSGPREIRLLITVFEKMRADLNHSRQQLEAWAGSLEKEVAERTKELEALFSVSRDIISLLELPDVLQSVTDQACNLLEGDAAFLCLLDNDGQALRLHANSGSRQAVWKHLSPVCSSPAAQVLSGDRALHCGKNGCQDSCQIISPGYRASHLVAPLRIGGQNSGALCVSSIKPDALSSVSCRQLDQLAHVAAIALENARLYQQAERSAMLEERQRIAAEMHDGLAQSISTIQMAVDMAKIQIEDGMNGRALESLSQSRVAIDQAMADVRKAISSLQDEPPISMTLQDLLSDLAGEFTSLECEVRWENHAPVPLVFGHQQSEQILRVAREALLNARSHSGAMCIVLRLSVNEDQGIVSVEDNGQGFDAQEQLENGKNGRHFGLKVMKARAARIGGSLDIRSSLGKGTCIVLTWPVSTSNGNGRLKT